ncbi:MAG TPA: arylesterase [Edaphobacter sp.]|nr:arylesterase [Edaphobacter sp.]
MGACGCRSENHSQQSAAESAAATQPRAETVAPVAATKPDNRPVLVCFGDSLTAGLGTGPGESYPDYLQADLDARGYGYRVVNEGISGNTTKDGVARLDHILALRPAVVVVEFGGNDGLRGLPIRDTRANLDKIITTLKNGGVKVALAGISLPPDYGPDYIRQFDETYTLLAKKHNVPMLPFLLKGVYGVDGMMQPDLTHATAAGNKIVAENVLPLVLPLLKK